MNRADLQTLSELRLQEARALLASGNPYGAYYLAGYSVECALKACIAKQTREGDFPDKKRALDAFDHNFDILLATADLKAEYDQESGQNPAFARDWTTLRAWSVDKRYAHDIQAQEAIGLIDAVENTQNSSEGALPWLRKYW